MPTAVLTNSDDPIFAFEHMMAHRRYFAVMSPLNRFSVLPYVLDPVYDTEIRASMWHQNHQQAHTDFATSLPANYNTKEIGLPTFQPVADSDLANPESATWWTFIQHREHFLADEAILPTQAGTFPFW